MVSLGHVVDFLLRYVRGHWDALHCAQFKDPALGVLVTLEKVRRAGGPEGLPVLKGA
jgi:hypothetical protein